MNQNIKQWLLNRKISEETLTRFNIHENSQGEIAIPIGEYNKYRKNPFETSHNPRYRYDPGATVVLYNAEALNHPNDELIVITEGEFDALVLESVGIHACTSTGGATSFQKEWGELFKDKTNISICLDADEAGLKGAIKIQQIIPHAGIVILPNKGGVKDVTDYFKEHSLADFLKIPATTYWIPQDLEPPYNQDEVEKKFEEIRNASERMLEEGRLDPGARHIELMKIILFDKYENLKMLRRNSNKQRDESFLSDVERAKQVSIQQFVKFKAGYAPCLFHNEKTASMYYYPKNNRYKCYGCGEHGSVVDIVMKQRGIGFKEAVKFLNNQ